MQLIPILVLATSFSITWAMPSAMADCQLDWSQCQASNDGSLSCYCSGNKERQGFIKMTRCIANDDGTLHGRVKYATLALKF